MTSMKNISENRQPGISEYTIVLERYLRSGWEEIVRQLPKNLRQRLRCPDIWIREDMKNWGSWQGGTVQRIELNARLLTEFSWPILMEIMKHEVAHQVNEHLNGEQPSHGEKFREICSWLGANPKASVLDPSLWIKEGNQSGEEDERTKILARLRKILALSESADVNEAEAALQKAREIALKYSVDLDETAEPEEEFAMLCLGKICYSRDQVQLLIGTLLRDFFEVRIIWHYAPSVLGTKCGSIMTIFGTPAHLKIAKYVYDCLTQFLESAWKNQEQEIQPGGYARRRYDKRDFQMGILSGFREKLAIQQEKPGGSTALIETRRQRLEDYYHSKNPNIRTIRQRSLRVNGELLDRGREIGREFSIRPGVEQEGQKQKLLKE